MCQALDLHMESFIGGEGGIRTHKPLARLPDFGSLPRKDDIGFFFTFWALSSAQKNAWFFTLFLILTENAHFARKVRISLLFRFWTELGAIWAELRAEQNRCKTTWQYTPDSH